jgi:hypothetical protein
MGSFVVRRQHSVGQGFFHSGQITTSGTQFRYVYDCGAMSPYAAARRREVKAYLAQIGESAIDALFISHAHADHLNGLPDLLKSKGRAKTIFLPLIQLADRLIAFARAASEDPTVTEDGFFVRFTLDPAAALGGFGPDRIIMFEPGEGGAPGGPNGAPPLEGATREFGLEELPWRLVGRGTLMSTGTVPGPAGAVPVLRVPDTAAIAPRGVKATGWLLAPYVDVAVSAKRAKFLRSLAKRLKKSVPKLKSWLDSPTNVEDLLTTKVAHLAAAYKDVEKDLNITSMSLYSGPADPTNVGAHRARFGTWQRIAEQHSSLGWLGTGDAKLSETGRRRAFLKHYQVHLPAVGTLTLPHHGSDDNFHLDLLTKICANFYVAASDAFSNWRHPGTATIQGVAGAGKFVSNITSSVRSRFFEELDVA